MNFNAVWFPSVNIVGMHKIVTVIFFLCCRRSFPLVTTLILKNELKVIRLHIIEEKFLACELIPRIMMVFVICLLR